MRPCAPDGRPMCRRHDETNHTVVAMLLLAGGAGLLLLLTMGCDKDDAKGSEGALPGVVRWGPAGGRAELQIGEGAEAEEGAEGGWTSLFVIWRHWPGGKSEGRTSSPKETRQRASTWLPKAAKMRRTSW